MAHVVAFRVQGYRAISAPIALSGLGPYVALFGDNAVGKSSVLRALALFGDLCRTHPIELLGTGRPWPMDAFLDKYGQDPWMFNNQGDPIIEIAATMNTGLDVAFKLTRVRDQIEVACTRALADGTDLAAVVTAARRALAEAHARQLADDSDDELTLEMDLSLTAAYERLYQSLSPVHVAMGTSPALPVPDSTRAALFGAISSPDVVLRNAVRTAMRQLGGLFPALGQGEIDVLANAPFHEKDLAWVASDPPSVTDLDHLGGGVQSAVATLASLLLSRAEIVCLEEPEAFVGARALDGLATIFRSAPSRKICDQVWIATHAVTLAGPEDPIVVLERAGGVVSARQGSASQLGGRFAISPPEMPADRLGRLGQDGSVRLPPNVIARAGLRAGDFVYFDDSEMGIRILTGEQVDATLADLPEP